MDEVAIEAVVVMAVQEVAVAPILLEEGTTADLLLQCTVALHMAMVLPLHVARKYKC